MSEKREIGIKKKCKNCKDEVDSKVWISPQFVDENVLLFYCDKCKKKYLENKLERIKEGYPDYYNKLVKKKVNNTFFENVS